ncbi:MAG: hypothetical protein FJX60_02515 [Alphaproteobacteria bacterium]|nr:hypothetical protein [Alphaproteobacteria bacterium]
MMTIRSTQHEGDLQRGDRFRHDRNDRVTETATVVATRVDAQGIPHVRFTVTFALPSGRVSETERSLSLETFFGRYRAFVN